MALVNNPYQKYTNVKVNTTSRGELVVMLYDACIKFIRELKNKIETYDFDSRDRVINSAIDILNELTISLEFKHNVELAGNLKKIYRFILLQITLSSQQNKPELLDSPISILNDLRVAWSEASNLENQKNN